MPSFVNHEEVNGSTTANKFKRNSSAPLLDDHKVSVHVYSCTITLSVGIWVKIIEEVKYYTLFCCQYDACFI